MEFAKTIDDGKNIAAIQQRFISKVYAWMFLALVLTAVVAWYIVASPQILQAIYANSGLFFVLIIAELALVIGISAAINKLTSTQATLLFFLYAALNGVTISVILALYTAVSVASTFLITAVTFGAMSFYGYVTKKDLTSWGNFLFMALIGLILASVVNMFWANPALYWLISYAGVLIFVGLTAYDTQRLKKMAASLSQNAELEQKGAVLGALRLYLDFINLFLMLLRIFGRRR